MVMDVFPDAVVVTDPEPCVEGLARDRLTGERIKILYRTDVRHARRESFGVQDTDARIDHVDVALTASRSPVQ